MKNCWKIYSHLADHRSRGFLRIREEDGGFYPDPYKLPSYAGARKAQFDFNVLAILPRSENGILYGMAAKIRILCGSV